MPYTASNRRNRSLMNLPGWGQKVLLLAIIPVPQYRPNSTLMLYFDIAMTLGGKVIKRSPEGQINSKQLKLSCFCCFSTIMFTLDDKVILSSQQGQIIYKTRVIIACFCYSYVHFRPWPDSSMKPSPNPCHHVLVSMGYNTSSPFIIIL